MTKPAVDKCVLLERLEPVEYERPSDQEGDDIEQMSLAACLLKLAEVIPEREFDLCRRLAEHLLGRVPEPESIDLEDAEE